MLSQWFVALEILTKPPIDCVWLSLLSAEGLCPWRPCPLPPVKENRAGLPSTETADLEATVRIELCLPVWDTNVTKPQTLHEGPSTCPLTGVSE